MSDRAAILVSTSLGVGYLPVAPGTFGSLVGCAIVWGVNRLALETQALAFCLLLGIAFWGVRRTQRCFGAGDDQRIVVDEVLGVWLTLFALPLTLLSVALGFVLFRAFDILKPFPVSWVDRKFHGPLGVIGDDLLAGVYACAILRVILTVFP